MRVERRGDGEPELAVVGGIHGDEPCGVRAIERILDEDHAFERPVAFVVANEEAAAENVRYLEADLNRSFPGDADAGTHEERLAADLSRTLAGCTVLSLHSTQSHTDPFAIVDGFGEMARRLVPRLPVVAAVDSANFVNGRLFAADVEVIEVECGLQGSRTAAENATRVVRAFLAATGALPGDAPERTVPAFRLVRKLPKPIAAEYEVFVENFERVDAGRPYAATNGERHVAEEPFYPVLLSATGYDDVYGYAADRVGTL